MVLALAMAIVGLNPEEFKNLIAKLTPQSKLLPGFQRPVSPSARSESSGIGTIAPSLRSSDGISPWSTPFSSRAPSVRSTGSNTPSLTPISSRSSTPIDEILKNDTEAATLLVNRPKKRDLLDLHENIKDPRWKIAHPTMPGQDFRSFLNNHTVYHHHLNNKYLTEEYPMRCCKDCAFVEPSPYLFGELYKARLSLTSVTKR